jgi:hypothetical protein
VSGALLSNEACALLLGVKAQSLRVRRMRGGGPPFIRLAGPSSRAFYREADVTRWLAEKPAYTSTHEEHAAAAAAAQASAPPRTRKRLSRGQAPRAAPRADSKRTTTSPARTRASRPRKS